MNNLANFCGANVGGKNFQENYVKGAKFDCETYTKCDKIERQPKTKRGNFKNIMLDKTKDNSNSFSILAGRGMSDNIDDKNFADLGDFPLAKSLAKTMRAREENVKFTPKIILDKIYNRRKNMHKKIASKSILANENCSNFEVGKISNLGVNDLADFKMEDCSTGEANEILNCEANEILNCEASGVLTGEANEVLNVGVDAVSSVGGKSAFGYGIAGSSDLKTDEISAVGTGEVPSMANVGSTEDSKNLDKVSDCVVNIDILVDSKKKSENSYGSVGKPEEMYGRVGKSEEMYESAGKLDVLVENTGKSENLYGRVRKSEEMYGRVGKPDEMYESVQKSDNAYENSKNIQIFETPTNVGCEEDLYSPKLSDRFLGMSGLSTIVLRSPEAVYGEGVEVSDDRTRLRVDGITSFGDDGMGLGALRHELGKITLDGGFYTSSDRMGKISTDENNVDFSEKNEQNLNKDNKKNNGQNLEIQNGVTQNVENQRVTSPNIENLKGANQPIESQGSASKKDYANDDLGKSLVIGMKVGEIGFGSVPEDVRKCELLNMKINRRDSENWTHKEWIKFFIKVEPCIAMCVKHFDNMFYRASVLSLDYNECAKFGSVENMFNELIELTERKKQYLKLKFFINRLKKELDEYDLMIIGYFVFDEDTRSALLEEMSRRTIYRRANRIFTKLTNFLVARGYTEKWLYKQFGMLTR